MENKHRQDYTEAEDAENYERLALFGLSVGDIAQETGENEQRVQAALAVRRSTTAAETLKQNPQLDMFQAAAFAEFDEDPDACECLMRTLQTRPQLFEHELEQLR